MSIFGTFISQSHHFLKTIRLIKYKTYKWGNYFQYILLNKGIFTNYKNQ